MNLDCINKNRDRRNSKILFSNGLLFFIPLEYERSPLNILYTASVPFEILYPLVQLVSYYNDNISFISSINLSPSSVSRLRTLFPRSFIFFRNFICIFKLIQKRHTFICQVYFHLFKGVFPLNPINFRQLINTDVRIRFIGCLT